MAIVLAAACAVVFVALLVIGDSARFGRVCAIIGAAVAIGVYFLVNRGKAA
ncbi:MAG: hypothetical protein ACI364_00715 [Coriobacteriales bacterium]